MRTPVPSSPPALHCIWTPPTTLYSQLPPHAVLQPSHPSRPTAACSLLNSCLPHPTAPTTAWTCRWDTPAMGQAEPPTPPLCSPWRTPPSSPTHTVRSLWTQSKHQISVSPTLNPPMDPLDNQVGSFSSLLWNLQCNTKGRDVVTYAMPCRAIHHHPTPAQHTAPARRAPHYLPAAAAPRPGELCSASSTSPPPAAGGRAHQNPTPQGTPSSSFGVFFLQNLPNSMSNAGWTRSRILNPKPLCI